MRGEGLSKGVVLYSTDCPRCKVLKQKLDEKNIEYTINDNVNDMIRLGLTQAPALGVDDDIKDFGDAVKWINSI